MSIVIQTRLLPSGEVYAWAPGSDDPADNLRVAYDPGLSVVENHTKVAKTLKEARGWSLGEWFRGATDVGYVFVRSISTKGFL